MVEQKQFLMIPFAPARLGYISGVLFICFFSASVVSPAEAQPPPPVAAETPTFRVQSSLVVVDVITQDSKSGLPVRDLNSEDFRVLDNGQEVPIASFETGTHYGARSVAVWLVVICNERGKVGGSAEFVGKETLFRPALDQLDKVDKVGVAHWCDNGEARIDLPLTGDRDSPIRVLAEDIKPITFRATMESNPLGEATFRRMIRLIIADAQGRNPQPLPVIVFLDGDYTGQPPQILNRLVDDLLETSINVFGIKDYLAPEVPVLINGEQGEILHYMAKETGGQYFLATPAQYANALEAIFMQLHFRYEIGFKPTLIDGKRHKLRIELTKEAKETHKGIRLKFRPEYIPIRGETP